ncbi:hypothetical protein [Streptomyces sp. NPDC020747]|uniref:hypothetical protein n=1 Tax=Streptomyces sp. NPDC020747 TaxID=3365086 RepID=UPI0037AE2927
MREPRPGLLWFDRRCFAGEEQLLRALAGRVTRVPELVLWTIDWEPAMIGDPLYELATHLHRMRYPVDQERRVIQQWCATVEEARPGSASGWERELPLVLDCGRAQSVFTDIIRLCLSPDVGRPVEARSVLRGARKVRKLLTFAAQPLGLKTVPSVARISNSPLLWHREQGMR